jgi:hypothetical protein
MKGDTAKPRGIVSGNPGAELRGILSINKGRYGGAGKDIAR